ncbi:MAG: response regulator [Gemmatimonadota bacterium]|nr:response regulator [Gemmatimonadota bacterium]
MSRRVGLTRSYVFALVATSAMMFAGAAFVDSALRELRGDGPLLNIVGRQRMLSQQVAKSALWVANAPDDATRSAARAEMRDAITEMAVNRKYLLEGDADRHLLSSPFAGNALRGAARDITLSNAATFAALDSAAHVASNPAAALPEISRAVSVILRTEPAYSSAVDREISALGEQSAERVRDTRTLMWSVVIVIQLALVAIGILVLRPAARSTRSALVALSRSNRELDWALEAAQETARAKSEFLATMSHELRTPLNAVIGLSGLMADTKLDDRQRLFVSTINRSGEALLGLINNVLDLSKIDAGKLELEMVDFDLREIVETTVETLALRAEGRNVELATFVAPALPAAFVGDPGRIRQVLLNLVGNALKFTEEGSVIVRTTRAVNGQVRFEVVDTGIGIPEDKIGGLFQAFAQVDASTTRKFGGTGLGLDISRRIVAMMHGTIGVTSRVGQGSTFWFELPLAPAAAQPAADPRELLGRRILIVDDNDANRLLLEEIARAWQMEPTAVAAAGAAIRELKQAAATGRPYDFALLDWQMPEVDGYGLARQIHSDANIAGTPLILISSFTHTVNDAEFSAAGFAARISKPVRQRPLRSALHDAIAPTATRDRVAHSAENVTTTPRYPGKRVLVADDNPVNVLVLKAMLEPYGVRADVAADGVEVLEALKIAAYDLILLDLYMPRLDGRGAAKAIREREAASGRPRAPIVAVTASVTEEDRASCLASGMDDYVGKPVARDVLDATLKRWLTTGIPATPLM